MKKSSVHITVVLDRSGSMQSIRDDIIGGFNVFLEEQKKVKGAVTLTMVQFDTTDPFEVIHSFADIHNVPALTVETFVPRGGTPLLDAMGRTIHNLTAWLDGRPKKERPEKLVVVFITDGQENSSREFNLDQIKSMIKKKQKNDDWQFVFLSADLDAVDDAQSVGIAAESVMSFDKNTKGTKAMFTSLSHRITDYSVPHARALCFCESDRAQQESEKKRT